MSDITCVADALARALIGIVIPGAACALRFAGAGFRVPFINKRFS